MRYRVIKPVHRGREVMEAGKVFIPAEIEMTEQTAKNLLEAGAIDAVDKRKKADKAEEDK